MSNTIDLISKPATTPLSRDYIEHTAFKTTLEAIEEAHGSFGSGDRPINLRIEGVSGVGKSTAFKIYAGRHPRRKDSTGTVVPVLLVSIPAQPTTKVLYTDMLRALGANDPGWGTADHQRARLLMLCKACGVELILMDELQHFIDRGTARTHGAVADALKSLLDELDIPCVLGGAPRGRKLFALNNQLRNRFTRTVSLRPFDGTTEVGLAELLGFVAALIDAFDEDIKDFLLQPQIAQRLFFATDGLPRLIADFLIEFRREVAKPAKEPDLDTAFTVFQKVIWPRAPIDRNPFSTLFTSSRLTEAFEPFNADSLDGDNHA